MEADSSRGSRRFINFFMTALGAALFLAGPGLDQASAAGDVFRIAITQAKSGAAQKYRPLETYLKGKGIAVQFVAARDNNDAVQLFSTGKVDAMFGGSGVGATLIMKDLVEPALRPLGKNGNSTYWAVVVAPKGSPAFDGKASYFAGKKALAAPLASSGEYFFRSLPGIDAVGATLLPAANHGAAIDALSKGAADVALVKNWVWEEMKGQYPQLEKVGEDRGQNPDGTLVFAKRADKAQAEKVKGALMGMNQDRSPAAEEVREAMGMKEFIPTTGKDFEHTIGLLSRSGVL